MESTTSAVMVRRAGVDDVDAVAPLFDAYRRFYGRPGDLPRARAFVDERLRRGESVVFLAERDGRAAGFTQLYPMFSSVGTGRVWLLNDLYVDAGARRGGVATALMQAATDFARSDGALRLTLETQRGNAAAQALYRRLGWVEETGTVWFTRECDA